MTPRKTRGRVLVVEDEDYVRDSLAEILRSRGFDVSVASGPTAAVASLEKSPVDVVLTDLNMPDGGGLGLLQRVRASWAELPVVVLTGFGTVASAVGCLKAGAADYVLKPTDPDALEVALDRAIESRALRREVAYLRREDGVHKEAGLVGESAPWRAVLSAVRAAAATDASVLLIGESGTGKELLARLVHRGSPRARGPYVRVNCAAVPLEIWESEFFGHRKGSFTGASSDRDGRFLLADRGTLFMDEVGAMPLAGQSKLLRVLEDGEFDRVGDEQPTRVDVRIVAATNSDLGAEARTGRFRQDLYYRLNVVRIDVPPLRDRPEDIPLLARHFAVQIAARLGRAAPLLPPALLSELAAYAWPGNVRELRNVIERGMILSPGETLDAIDIAPAHPAAAPGAEPAMAADLNLRAAIDRRERELIVAALQRAGGVRKEAARLLGIDGRNLGYYFRKHAIDPDKQDDGGA
jgi:DNA-binding NtrC family response regulator